MKDENEELIDVCDYFRFPVDEKSHPADIGARLIDIIPEFLHLKNGNPRIEYLLRKVPKTRNGRAVIGEAMRPSFQGGNKMLGDWLMAGIFQGTPDFLIVLDDEWWTLAGARQREILIHHELSHCAHATDKEGEPKYNEDGNPVWTIRAHDIEEFNDTVRRYGAWSDDVVKFLAAARSFST